MLFTYSIFQSKQIKQYLTPDQFEIILGMLIAISVLLGLYSVFLVFVARKLFAEFGWSIYKKIGADAKLVGKPF